MFNQVLVGVDEHECGRDAIALAKQLVAADGQVTLVCVETSEPERYRGVRVMYEVSERERTLDRLRNAREQAQIDAEIAYSKPGPWGAGFTNSPNAMSRTFSFSALVGGAWSDGC